jgi:neutral ceramidase
MGAWQKGVQPMIDAGAAVIDITPPPGLAMSGFAARSLPATGAHDALTARAVVIGNTAVVVADVIGISAEMSTSIRQRCVLPAGNVVVAALHTHGGPVSMRDRLGIAADLAYLERLEDACVAAIDRAAARRQPATLSVGQGGDPGIARNRRHPGGPVDASLPLLRIRGMDGDMIALVSAYACHPVVLSANNLLWTADYPHFIREALEEAYPGAIAVLMTGCAGDSNTGHSVHASLSLNAGPDRSFAAAKRIGRKIADAALTAGERILSGTASARSKAVALGFERRESEAAVELADVWQREALEAAPARKNLLGFWMAWARTIAPVIPDSFEVRVTVLDWCGLPVVALPGEIFAETALSIRTAHGHNREGGAGEQVLIMCFADDNPGYIPPAGEFVHGGYEVDEAHRYYGQPATFAPGSAETLADCALSLLTHD